MTTAAGSLRQRLVRATLGSAVARVCGMAVTFLTGILLARKLGPTAYGVYGTIIAMTLVLSVITQAGLPQLVTREFARYAGSAEPGKVKGPLVWFPLLICATGCVAMAAVYAVTRTHLKLIDNLPDSALVWGIFLIPLTALANLGVGMLRGLHRTIAAQFQDAFVRPVLFVILLVVLLLSTPGRLDATSAVALQTIASAIGVLICTANIAMRLPASMRHTAARNDVRDWARGASAMGATDIVRMFDAQSAVFIIGSILTIRDVGLYRVAIAASALTGLPITLVILAVVSHLTELYAKGDRARLQKLLTATALAVFLGTTFVTLLFFLFGKPLVALAFGPAYLPAWSTIVVLGLSSCVLGFSAGASALLNMCGRERELLAIFAAGLFVNLGSSVILLPHIGILGAAVGTLLGEIFRSLCFRIVALRHLHVEPSLLAMSTFLRSLRKPAA